MQTCHNSDQCVPHSWGLWNNTFYQETLGINSVIQFSSIQFSWVARKQKVLKTLIYECYNYENIRQNSRMIKIANLSRVYKFKLFEIWPKRL